MMLLHIFITAGHMTIMFCWCFVLLRTAQFQWSFFNITGSVHDSQIADWDNIYLKLGSVYEKTGAKCMINSAFSKA